MKATGRVIYFLGKPLIFVNSVMVVFVQASGDGDASPDAVSSSSRLLLLGVSPSREPGEKNSADAFADTPDQRPSMLP